MKEITDIKEIQKISLDVLKYVDKVCKENNINYSLCYGTLLGAIRHKGFIPWDDDIDIMMTRDNFEKFLHIMDKDGKTNKKYKCLHYGKDFPNYFYPYAKIVDLNTELYEFNHIRNDNMGVYIDLFPIDYYDNEISNRKNKQLLSVLYESACIKYVPSKHGKMRSVAKFFVYILSRFFKWKYFYNKYNKFVLKNSQNKSEMSKIYCGGYDKKEIMSTALYNEIQLGEFENTKFSMLKDYDIYLTKIYGDYMTPPPKNKQISHHEYKAYYKKD